MPTYRYRCAKCGEQFDVWQSIHDNTLTAHDGDCGGALSKVMAVGGIVLKGSGFYRTDNRAKPSSREGREGKDEGAKSKETAGANGSGDKKDKQKDPASADSARKPSKSGSSSS
jgi:putative FmdB family regulatory protein